VCVFVCARVCVCVRVCVYVGVCVTYLFGSRRFELTSKNLYQTEEVFTPQVEKEARALIDKERRRYQRIRNIGKHPLTHCNTR